ncbi:MAG: helix-turn-helix domain-containing protein [Deltaproteobacteria bacterium]
MTGKLLAVREAAQYLNITEKEVIDLAEKGVIPAYKVGGVYLRFKKEQIDAVRPKIKPNATLVAVRGSFAERVRDFVYHYDFYILSLVVIGLLLYFIVTL